MMKMNWNGVADEPRAATWQSSTVRYADADPCRHEDWLFECNPLWSLQSVQLTKERSDVLVTSTRKRYEPIAAAFDHWLQAWQEIWWNGVCDVDLSYSPAARGRETTPATEEQISTLTDVRIVSSCRSTSSSSWPIPFSLRDTSSRHRCRCKFQGLERRKLVKCGRNRPWAVTAAADEDGGHVTLKGQTRCNPNTLKSPSRKRPEIETPFHRTTNRKWPMGFQLVTWPTTSRDLKRSNSWSWLQCALREQYLENSWRWYLATILITRVCCEAVLSVILATAWLLVFDPLFLTSTTGGEYALLLLLIYIPTPFIWIWFNYWASMLGFVVKLKYW